MRSSSSSQQQQDNTGDQRAVRKKSGEVGLALKCAVAPPCDAPVLIAAGYQFATTSRTSCFRRAVQAITVRQTATNELISIF